MKILKARIEKGKEGRRILTSIVVTVDKIPKRGLVKFVLEEGSPVYEIQKNPQPKPGVSL